MTTNTERTTTPSLFDADNDGYTDNIDILPKIASPGDLDNDECDEDDAFPSDYRESKDSDGDGEGDNADIDDDNDGWTDTDEIRLGADPYSSAEKPVEGFEIILPELKSLGCMGYYRNFHRCTTSTVDFNRATNTWKERQKVRG